MNGVFVAQAQVKNVINFTALNAGRQPAQKYVPNIGDLRLLGSC